MMACPHISEPPRSGGVGGIYEAQFAAVHSQVESVARSKQYGSIKILAVIMFNNSYYA